MLTINAEVVKNQRKTNDCFTVRLRFTLDRKMKRLATSLFATPKDLTKDLKIKQTSPLKREVDNLVRAYQEKCAKLQIELNHTRPYIAYVDADGRIGKPFVVPQKKGNFYFNFMNSYNIPEFVKGKIEVEQRELLNVLCNDIAKKVTFGI